MQYMQYRQYRQYMQYMQYRQYSGCTKVTSRITVQIEDRSFTIF